MEKLPNLGVVGNASEKLGEGFLDLIQERFNSLEAQFTEEEIKEIEKEEVKKTPEQIAMINFINDEINQLMEKFGIESFDVPEKNIHLLNREFFNKKFAKEGYSNRSFFDPSRQMILVCADKFDNDIKLLDFAHTIFHEILHMKGKNVFEIFWNNDETISYKTYRVGYMAESTNEKDLGGKKHKHFEGFTEAIVETQTKSFVVDKLLKLPENKKYLDKYNESVKNSNGLNDGFGGMYDRKVLDFVCDEIAKEFPEKYLNKESVFEEFLKANFTGRILETGRLVEKTFGKGSFRILGDMNPDTDSTSELIEKLKNNRIEN
jgi:hypothetical protein